MNNSKNPNNKKLDNNNNNKNHLPYKDISDNIVFNPFYNHLQCCNNKINEYCRIFPSNNLKNIKLDKQRDINVKNVYFNMTFSSLLDEIRHNRLENKNKLDSSHNKITKSLDNINKLSLVTIDKNKNNKDFNKFLKNVTDKYNLIYNDNLGDNSGDNSGNNSGDNSGNNSGTNTIISRWGENYRPRKNSIWIPGLNTKANIYPPPPDIRLRRPLPPPPPLLPPPPPLLPPIIKKKIFISREINGLGDILKLIDDYPLKFDIEYNINMEILHNINQPLRNLNSMIGMNTLKTSIVDQVIYFLQGLDKNNDFMHTVIYGPPGTGKTEVAKIMGSIFASIGVLNKNTFKKVTRSDLIAGYLGQTAIKTKDVIKESLGGVLFIDEAYSLGNSENKDSFAKECIDTLCESLSNHKSKLMVIIAGYEEDLKKCFFAYNQGLDSRFPWRFYTDNYTAAELNLILKKKVDDIKWSIDGNINDAWFESKMEYFKFYGRDMEILLAKTKIAHSRRVFCKAEKDKTKITMTDINRGFDMFIANTEVKDRKNNENFIPYMYI